MSSNDLSTEELIEEVRKNLDAFDRAEDRHVAEGKELVEALNLLAARRRWLQRERLAAYNRLFNAGLSLADLRKEL